MLIRLFRILVCVQVAAGFGPSQPVGWSMAKSVNIQRSSLLRSSSNEASIDRLSDEGSDSFLSDESGNTHIPGAGYSVSDEMEAAVKDRWVTEVVEVKGLPGVAQLVTTAVQTGSFEPVRYLVALTPPPTTNATNESLHPATAITEYALIDLPPFSPQLVTRIRGYIQSTNGRLVMAVITTRDAIHYDEAPSVYQTRRADLDMWKAAFPGLTITGYRLDIPRDCRHAVTQVLDGYGPFALQEEGEDRSLTFIESGRPLTYDEWPYDVAEEAMNGNLPPDNNVTALDDYELYTPQAIRKREEGHRILAVYTPGHSYGSVSYIFPATGVCCSGFTIPVEDNREEDNFGIGTPGPALDVRGYITTSRESRRQMESAKALVKTYADRFHVVLPSRGDPLFLDGDADNRKDILLDNISQFERIGQIYEQLGIFADEYDD